jgi:N-acetylneuraminic acid mutarotase
MKIEDRVQETLRHQAARIRPRDALPDLLRRVEEPDRGERDTSRRLVAAAIAFAVFAAAGVFAWRAFEPLAGRRPVGQSSATDPWRGVGSGWTELPASPEVREGAAYVWAGTELLAWGGVRPGIPTDYENPTLDGFAFDPATMSWSRMPPAPLPGKYAKAIWTGNEAIFFGQIGTDSSQWEGEAFDPIAKTWRVIAQPPLSLPRYGEMVVWTGSEMIVWGGGESGDPSNDSGAAYDPSTDTWRRIADAPIGLNQGNAVWTGQEMVVFGSLLNGRNIGVAEHAFGASYTPSTGTWQEIALSKLSPQADSAVWVGNGMLAWDYEGRAQVFDPGTDAWGEVQKMPIEFNECYPDSTLVGSVVFAWYCGQVATWDSITGQWQSVGGGLTEPTVEANGKQYKLYRFANLVPAGDVVVLAAEGITVSNKGVPCYGCPGAPQSLWVYRPP